jgi:hypothetical protein
MTSIRLAAFLLLVHLAAAQQALPTKQAGPDIQEPGLPVIDHSACPLEGNAVPNVKIDRLAHIHSSWQSNLPITGMLKPGERVTVLKGVNVIHEPGIAAVKRPLDLAEGPPLKIGDMVLQYGLNAGGYWEFWAKGAWFTQYIENVAEKGQGCHSDDFRGCSIEIVKNSTREWWVQVKASGGRSGWVLAEKNAGDKSWSNRNFAGLCAEDGD